MRNTSTKLPLALAFLALITVPSEDSGADAECIGLSNDVSRPVVEILDLRSRSITDSDCSDCNSELESKLAPYRSTDNSESRSVFCNLLNFYLGESTDSDVLFEVTECGEPCLEPLLEFLKYRPCVPEKYRSLFHREETRQYLLKIAIEAIENEETIGSP